MLVALTDPSTEKEFLVNPDHILSVFPAGREFRPARTFISLDIVQYNQQAGHPVCTTLVTKEPYSQVKAILGIVDPHSASLEAQEIADDAAVEASPIALPDRSVVANFIKR